MSRSSYLLDVNSKTELITNIVMLLVFHVYKRDKITKRGTNFLYCWVWQHAHMRTTVCSMRITVYNLV